MPINFLDIISSPKPPVAKKWQEVYRMNSVHTQGACPEEIFEERRPMESENPQALDYRKRNHRPVTKDEFDKAISGSITCAMSIDAVINYGENSLVKDYETKIRLKDGMNLINLKEWVMRRNGAYRQTDPNAIAVILPKHPTQEFIPDYTSPIPNFDAILEKRIDVEVRLVTHSQIVAADPEYLVFMGGYYKYGPKADASAPFYYAITKDQTFLLLPYVADKKKIAYKEIPYYKNSLQMLPAVVIGGKKIIEQYEDGSTMEYYVSDYFGAIAWADLATGQGSDLRLCEVRYVYPRHWVIPSKCKADNATWSDGYHVLTDDVKQKCTRCNGLGVVFDASPMGSRIVEMNGDLFNDGKFVTPEGFITPPVDILKHSADREEYYFDRMLNSLCILRQNMTNQSAESKKPDIAHKIEMNTRIVTDLYLTYVAILNIIDQYLGGKGEVSVSFPEDFDVLNANDVLYQLTELRNNKAPTIILGEYVKKYMLKAFGDSPMDRKILDFLVITDKLFAYGVEDLQTVKSVYGSDISSEDIIYNTQAFPILKKMLEDDPGLIEKEPMELKTVLLAEIIKYFPTQNNTTVA